MIWLFFYVFDFELIKNLSISSTSYITLVVMIIFMCCNREFNDCCMKYLGSKLNRCIFTGIIVLLLYSSLSTIVNFAFDFSYQTVLLHQLVYLEIGVLVGSYYIFTGKDLLANIIDCFFLQSIIQILSMLSSTFLRITDLFRTDATIYARVRNYDGFRGLAISGSNFFGLAVAYIIVFIIIIYYWNKWNANPLKRTIYIVFLIVGALSAGRTAIIGIVCFLLFFIIQFLSKRKFKAISILWTVAVIVLFIAAFRLLGPYLRKLGAWQRLQDYIFQVFGERGNRSISNFSMNNSSSLKQLISQYYFKLSPEQFFLGDGKYTDKYGYYMGTDAGFMRNILYGGIFLETLLYLYQIRMLFSNVQLKKQKVIMIVMIICLTVCEYKGQTIGFLLISQGILLLFSLSFINEEHVLNMEN